MQKREAGKNYISLLSEAADEPRTAGVPAAADHGIRDYVASLVAALLNRRNEAR